MSRVHFRVSSNQFLWNSRLILPTYCVLQALTRNIIDHSMLVPINSNYLNVSYFLNAFFLFLNLNVKPRHFTVICPLLPSSPSEFLHQLVALLIEYFVLVQTCLNLVQLKICDQNRDSLCEDLYCIFLLSSKWKTKSFKFFLILSRLIKNFFNLWFHARQYSAPAEICLYF